MYWRHMVSNALVKNEPENSLFPNGAKPLPILMLHTHYWYPPYEILHKNGEYLLTKCIFWYFKDVNASASVLQINERPCYVYVSSAE